VDVATEDVAVLVIAPTLNTTAAFHTGSDDVAVVVPTFMGFTAVLKEREVRDVLYGWYSIAPTVRDTASYGPVILTERFRCPYGEAGAAATDTTCTSDPRNFPIA
jgi:hypothetical protein